MVPGSLGFTSVDLAAVRIRIKSSAVSVHTDDDVHSFFGETVCVTQTWYHNRCKLTSGQWHVQFPGWPLTIIESNKDEESPVIKAVFPLN